MAAEYEKNCSEVLFRCGRHCCICRRFRPSMLQVHHIIERCDGGGDDIDNLIAVCLTCHSESHTKRPFCQRFTPEELRRHRERVYEMVSNGTLVPPDDHVVPADDTFVITAQDGLVEPKLAKEAVDILLAAVQSDDGVVLTLRSASGYTIQAGRVNLVPSQSPRDTARFKAAIEELIDHGYLAGNDQVLRVTHEGFRLADELEAVSGSSP